MGSVSVMRPMPMQPVSFYIPRFDGRFTVVLDCGHCYSVAADTPLRAVVICQQCGRRD